MVNTKTITINKATYIISELTSQELNIFEPFLEKSFCINVEAENCIEDILLTFCNNTEARNSLRHHNCILFHRKFSVKSLYAMSTQVDCIYTSFKKPDVCFHSEPVKVHIMDNFKFFCEKLQARGLEEHIARYFVASMLTSDLPETYMHEIGQRLDKVDLQKIKHVYEKNIIKDGESPIRILNGISERQQQKNLNLKRPKTDSGKVCHNSLHVYESLENIQLNQFYLHTNNFKYFYYIVDLQILFQFLNNSKQYIQAFQYCSAQNTYLIVTRDKKIENNCKKKFQLMGGEIQKMPIPFDSKKIKLYNIAHRNIEPNQWFIPYNESQFLDLNKFAMKTITMQIKPKFYEFRLYCKKEHIEKLILSAAYKYFFVYEKHDDFDIMNKVPTTWYNISIYVYYLDVAQFIDGSLVPMLSNDVSGLMLPTTLGVLQLGLLYTTHTECFQSTAKRSDNAIRFLYMKQTNSMHPYPDSQENAELMNSLKVKIRISEITNSKIEGSKHIHDGAMNAILSERGLYVTSEKKTHNKWFKHEDSRSCIFFNEPPLQNCQNPKLPINFTVNS